MDVGLGAFFSLTIPPLTRGLEAAVRNGRVQFLTIGSHRQDVFTFNFLWNLER